MDGCETCRSRILLSQARTVCLLVLYGVYSMRTRIFTATVTALPLTLLVRENVRQRDVLSFSRVVLALFGAVVVENCVCCAKVTLPR